MPKVKWVESDPTARLCLPRLYVKICAGAGVFPGVWHPRVCKSWEKSHSLNSLSGMFLQWMCPYPWGWLATLQVSMFSVLWWELLPVHVPRVGKASLERGEHKPGSFLCFVRMLMVRSGVVQNQIKWDLNRNNITNMHHPSFRGWQLPHWITVFYLPAYLCAY